MMGREWFEWIEVGFLFGVGLYVASWLVGAVLGRIQSATATKRHEP